ncbi:triacylglycerol lipase II precursor [Fusarium coicis]|nr:triacylglycerol lipase II precursor [Fusarium coicis]
MLPRLSYIVLLCTPSFTGLVAAAKPVDSCSSTTAPRVNLGYAKYEGVALSNGVNQFLGMRYAAPPTRSRRFRLPDRPLNETHLVQAHKHGAVCYGVNPFIPTPDLEFSEDCLFIDVYAPKNATLNKNGGLPVMLWIQGGGFVQNIIAIYNGSGLIEATRRNMIVATFNYRVGPYGFLANHQLKEEGNLNVGLHDQMAAINWIHEHISKFGGDPEKVTLFGTSVGGGSRLGMSAPQAKNTAIPFPGQHEPALFGYGPTIDGSFLPDRPSSLLQQGRFAKDKPIILGSSNTEGMAFAPQANTTDDVNQFLTAQLPGLTKEALSRLNHLCSDIPATFPNVNVTQATLYYRAAEMLGDFSFLCPAFQFAAGLHHAGVPAYLYLDRILDPVEVAAGYIVPHTWDTQAVCGPSFAVNYAALPGASSYEPGQSNAPIVPVVQAFWTSFARSSGNPNIFRASGTPAWNKSVGGSFLNIETNNTRMEQISSSLLEKCAYWVDLGAETRQ